MHVRVPKVKNLKWDQSAWWVSGQTSCPRAGAEPSAQGQSVSLVGTPGGSTGGGREAGDPCVTHQGHIAALPP